MREYDPNHRYQVITCASADFTDEDMSFRTVAEARTRIAYLVKEYAADGRDLDGAAIFDRKTNCCTHLFGCAKLSAFSVDVATQIPRYARGQHNLLLHLLQRPRRSAFHPLRPAGRQARHEQGFCAPLHERSGGQGCCTNDRTKPRLYFSAATGPLNFCTRFPAGAFCVILSSTNFLFFVPEIELCFTKCVKRRSFCERSPVFRALACCRRICRRFPPDL